MTVTSSLFFIVSIIILLLCLHVWRKYKFYILVAVVVIGTVWFYVIPASMRTTITDTANKLAWMAVEKTGLFPEEDLENCKPKGL